MKTKQSRIQVVIMLVVGLMLLMACSFGGSSDDAQDLRDQIRALETQNAILQKENAAESAPPPPVSEAAPEVEIAEPAAASLPTEPVAAGTPIIYDGWSMLVSKEIAVDPSQKNWGINIALRNLGDTKRIFRFTNAGVTAKDDLGNVYDPSNEGAGWGENCEEAYHRVKNLEVNAGSSIDIMAHYLGYNNCVSTNGIHMFDGLIPLEASQLIIHLEDFGPYSGVDVVIDL